MGVTAGWRGGDAAGEESGRAVTEGGGVGGSGEVRRGQECLLNGEDLFQAAEECFVTEVVM